MYDTVSVRTLKQNRVTRLFRLYGMLFYVLNIYCYPSLTILSLSPCRDVFIILPSELRYDTLNCPNEVGNLPFECAHNIGRDALKARDVQAWEHLKVI